MVSIRILFFVFLLCLLAIIVRLFYLQVLNPELYAAQYLTSRRITPQRGRILDRNNLPLITNQTQYLLYAEPKKIKNIKKMIRTIDEVTEMGEATIASRIDMKKDWVAIDRGLTKKQKQALEKKKMPALGFRDEYERFYPESSLSAHLVGFVGKNESGDQVGYFGVEGYYQKELSGLPGFVKSERDVLGKPIFVGLQQRMDAENGRDLVLTIDKSVQNIVKTKVAEGVKRYKAKSGCIIVANPSTMELLALACVPDYAPETYYEYSEEVFKNPAISSVYEPGSTFKPLIVAAAIEEERIKATDFFNEEDELTIQEATIKNWDEKYEGKITMTRILEKSSNVGMVYIGGMLGKENIYTYLKEKYRFDQLTGIDLEGEIAGYLKPEESWYPIDYATATFGQGIAITPLQLIRAFSSLVNGGNLMKPYVVKEIRDGTHEPRIREPYVEEKLFSERTSRIMRRMLVSTVQHAEIDMDLPEGYLIGGKTGTAQIAVGGNYDASKTIASFIGFAPAEDPQFIALVVLHEPGVSSWGSETAAPLFFEVAKDLLTYYNIPPSGS